MAGKADYLYSIFHFLYWEIMGVRGDHDDPIALVSKGLRKILREYLNATCAWLIEGREDAYAGSVIQDLPLRCDGLNESPAFGLEL